MAAKTSKSDDKSLADQTDTTPPATSSDDAPNSTNTPPAAKPEAQGDDEERREFVTVSLVRMAGLTRPVGSILDLTRAEFDTFKRLKAIEGDWD